MAAVASRAAGGAQRGATVVPFSGMRKVIADRMILSQQTAAQTTHQVSVDMTEAGKLRAAFKKQDKRVSYNDIVALATCRALKDYPVMNSELTDEGILVKDYVNLGIAVAIDRGLIVPVINDADLMTVEEIGAMTRELADKAKNGTLGPDEYKGGTFTISNLGMFGLDSFVAIINQPESGILAVGGIKQTPVVLDSGEITARPILTLTLSYDHRVVDGAPAAQFLSAIKAYLEQPYLLL
jgi:pyruvate dehydrogenase E2 component (dihydrolipoamide acetyltransferase)